MMRLKKWKLAGRAGGSGRADGFGVRPRGPCGAIGPPLEISSFSGAYLAARVAEVDNDLEDAIAYYRKALAFDPENQPLQQSLMLALISEGRFDEALPYAEKLKAVAEIERFSRLALAVDAFRKKDYRAAETWLKLHRGIRSRRADHQGHDRLGEARRRRQGRRHGDARRAGRAGLVRALRLLQQGPDRRGRPG